jgi:hypothetical protein
MYADTDDDAESEWLTTTRYPLKTWEWFDNSGQED